MLTQQDSRFHGTTILCVRKNGKVAIGGDGQVTLGQTVMKHNARKIRTMYNKNVLAGFAGATADAFTLFEKFETKIETYKGNITRLEAWMKSIIGGVWPRSTPVNWLAPCRTRSGPSWWVKPPLAPGRFCNPSGSTMAPP